MLSPPHHITTRSGLITGKKRPINSPVRTKEREDNNNTTPTKVAKKQLAKTPTKVQNSVPTNDEAKTFAKWFQTMLDDDRHNLSLYLADEVILEWFGRTIRTRKKVSGFLEFDMQSSRHHFVTSVGCPPFAARVEKAKRDNLESPKRIELAAPLEVPETPTTKLKTSLTRLTVRGSSAKKRPGLRSNSASPEKRLLSPLWENNLLKHTLEDSTVSEKKRVKLNHIESMDVDDVDSDSGRGRSETKSRAFCRKLRFEETSPDAGIEEQQGDTKKKKFPTTPVKHERGQGDCLPSTSSAAMATSARSLLVSNMPRKYVECNGFIEFTRSKNKRCIDAMKWERKCKVQVCYTDDPVNESEYTIWTIIYSDDIKCRRNLLAAFEEAEKTEEARKKIF